MSYTSINNDQHEDENNKNAPISSTRTAAVTPDDNIHQNLEQIFQSVSTEDHNSITTTSTQTPNSDDNGGDDDGDDSNKEKKTRPSSHSSASSIGSEENQSEDTTDDNPDQQLVSAGHKITLLNAQIVRQRVEHQLQIDQLTAQHELELQSIGCLQINTCRINTDSELCEQELLKLQRRFTTTFGIPAFDTEPTTSLLSRFHRIQAALADLRAKIPALNSIAEQQNLSLLRIRQDAETHISHALQVFETYGNIWNQTTKQNENTLRNQIPTLIKQERLLTANIHELIKLLKQVPGNAGTVIAYMPCGTLDTLELTNNKLSKQFLTYDSELAEQRFKLCHASQELMHLQLAVKTALTSFQEYFPKQHTTHPIAVCTNTYRTGFVKETSQNSNSIITRSTSLPPKLHEFRFTSDVHKPSKLIK
eukprot:gene4377-4960_t